MTSLTRDARQSDSHREIEELLPWYANGALDPAERARVEQHLEHCPACRADLAQCRTLAQWVETHDTATWQPAPAAFDRLMADIDQLATSSAPIEPAKAPPPLFQRILGWLRETPSPVRWTLAFESMAVAALVLAVLLPAAPVTDASYETLSRGENRPAAAGPQVRVMFADPLTVGDLRALLQEIGGQMVAGPNSLGIYTIALAGAAAPDVALRQALAVLRAHRQVQLAEPLSTGDPP